MTTASSHVDTTLDFARYHTFEWGDPDVSPVGDPRLDHSATFLDYLQGAVERQMAAKGNEHTAGGHPDLLIDFHASIDHRVEVAATDARHGYCLDDACRNGVQDYEAGP